MVRKREKRKVESELIRDNLDSYWKGEYVNGTLYVWREQGLGEEILFSSNLLLLKNLAKKVILEVDERLVGLLGRYFKMKNFDNIQIIPYNFNKTGNRSIAHNIKASDKHISLGSIGMYLLKLYGMI